MGNCRTVWAPNRGCPVLEGDVFEGAVFSVVDKATGDPFPLDGFSIKTQYREKTKTGNLLLTQEIGSGLSWVDQSNGIFQIDPFLIDFPVGVVFSDIEFKDPALPAPYTWVTAKWSVEQSVTQP